MSDAGVVARDILSDITVFMKYARYIPELERRETWDELVDRNVKMHVEKYPQIKDEIEDVYNKFVRTKKVLPSMRGMQFGGRPIELNEARGYNCSFLPVEDIEAFSETMFLLLSGTGVGYSVQNHHVDKLPPIKIPQKTRKFLIDDSITGWADAVKVLMRAYLDPNKTTRPIFDYRDIRKKGARLITSGGKAPGPEPLKLCLTKIESLLSQKEPGSKLTTLEAHDIQCHIADAVLSGGIRRAAMISLFSFGDKEMASCKSGSWWELNPQRGRANNSVVLLRHRITKNDFFEVWDYMKSSGAGEPGFMFSSDKNVLTNPCFSEDTLVQTRQGHFRIKELVGKVVDVWNGEDWQTIDNFRVTGENQQLLKIEMQDGSEFRVTPNHTMILSDGTRIPAKDMQVGDRLQITESDLSHGTSFIPGAYLKGFLTGDGTSISGKRPILFLYKPKYMCQSRLLDSARELKEPVYNTSCNKDLMFVEDTEDRMRMLGLTPYASELIPYCIDYKEKIPDEMFSASLESKLEYIAGVMDADGTASDTANGFMYQISSINRQWLLDFQSLLKTIGVNSKLSTMHPSTIRDFKDGYGEYETKDSFRLTISQSASKRLSSVVNFSRLISFEDKKITYSLSPRFNMVVSITEDEVAEKVYCCTVFGNNQISLTAGINIGQCAEISLNPYQFCNLTEINASNINDQNDYNERARAAAFIGTLQAGYTDFYYLRPEWSEVTSKEALLGVGMTGIASGCLDTLNMREASEVVLRENERVANLIGINIARRTTTVKPSGTTSLVLGSSSGVHAWHNDYYLRRIRVNKNEAIYAYLAIFHPELIEDEYFSPDTTAVITIPQKAPEGAITRHNESALNLLERARKIHNDWIKPGHRKGDNTHNVSITVNIKDNEWDEVRDYIWDNRNSFTAISCLPHSDHTYKQAPFEDTDEETYNRLVETLSMVDLTRVIEPEDNTSLADNLACYGQSCNLE
jgi:ribonucleotide reductase alpha subunit